MSSMARKWRKKYFLNLEKRNHVKKHIRKLNINGTILTDPTCILMEQGRFYRELYKSSYRDQNVAQNISSFLSELNIPKLSEEQKRSCEGGISSEECVRLLDSFHNNKTLTLTLNFNFNFYSTLLTY